MDDRKGNTEIPRFFGGKMCLRDKLQILEEKIAYTEYKIRCGEARELELLDLKEKRANLQDEKIRRLLMED